MLNALRRFIQIAVIFFLISILSLNLYESHKVKQGGEELIQSSSILSFIDGIIGKNDSRTSIATFFRGNLWSLEAGNLTFSDPLAILSYLVKSKKIHIVFFISALIPLLLTFALGRFYCGWICPMNLFLELTDRLKSFFERKKLQTFDIRFPLYTRHIILATGVIAGLLAGVEFFQISYPPRLVSIIFQDFFFGTALTYGVWIVAGIAGFEFLFSRRVWCRNICPGGTLYSYASGKSLLKIEPVNKKCTGCEECKKICPYELKPFESGLDGTCDKCGLCIDTCREGAIDYVFKRNKAGGRK